MKINNTITWERKQLEEDIYRDYSTNEGVFEFLTSHYPVSVYESGKTLYMQGDDAENMYIVVTGEIRHIHIDMQGREVIIASSYAGDYVGLISLFLPNQHECQTVVAQESQLCIIPKYIVRELQENILIFKILMEKLCHFFQRIYHCLEVLILPTIESRLAALFQHLIGRFGTFQEGHWCINHKLTQQELAIMINASRPKVNAQLQQWGRQEIISLKKRSIHILDLAYLQNIIDVPCYKDVS